MNESFWIWTFFIAITAGITLPVILRQIIHNKRNFQQKEEAQALGIDKPKAQHPMVDLTACIGCGACIRACPEGGVLGLVQGKAHIINGFRCVGHGLCQKACPVEAVTVGLGDLKKRTDIPQLNNGYETNMKGIFIVGELGGLALIKNAIEQGQKCIARMADIIPQPDLVDLLIIGAGPAGLSTALAAKQRGWNYRIIDRQNPGGTILQYPRKKLVLTQPVEIPLVGALTKSEYSKEELLEIWQQAIQDQGIKIETGIQFQSVQSMEVGFKVQTSLEVISTQRIVLAMGRRGTPRKLGVPGEEKSKVAYQLIDAAQHQNDHILVVGGGDSAIEAAMGLAEQSNNTVTLSYRKSKFFRIKARNEERMSKMLQDNKLNVMFESEPQAIEENYVSIKQKGDVQTIPNHFVYIFAGGLPPFQLLKEAGIAFGGEGNENL